MNTAESKYKYGIYIGRFQPFHKIHRQIVLEALDKVDQLIIFVGSSNATPDIKNPFTADERITMMKLAVNPHMHGSRAKKKVGYTPIRDFYYNENMWIAEIQREVNKITNDPEEHSIALFGSYKDNTSYYIDLFPQWKFEPTTAKSHMNATSIRDRLFTAVDTHEGWDDNGGTKADRCWRTDLPEEVADWIEKNFIYKRGGKGFTDRYKNLKNEYDFIKWYKEQFNGRKIEDVKEEFENLITKKEIEFTEDQIDLVSERIQTAGKHKYPPTFVTADSVVIKSGHVLLIERLRSPGKGLIALPGGFVGQDELVEVAALRELKEECKLRVDMPVLRRSIVGSRVFDYPSRSLRGRTITHAFHIDLGDGRVLPEVKGSDDAKRAFWMPIDQALSQNNFFEDHWHILYHFFVQARFR